jgi:alpha-mannosidase
MVHRSRLAALRALTLVDEVLAPAAHPHPQALAVRILDDPAVTDGHAALESPHWRPFGVGEVFGPPWSRLWFRLEGRAPAGRDDAPLWLGFDCGCEGLLRRPDGRPWHGLDPNRTRVPLPGDLPSDGRIDLLVEVHTNRPLGATTFFFDAPELRARWSTPLPGRLDMAQVSRHDARAWRLAEAFRVAAELVESLGAGNTRGNALARALEDARRPIEDALPVRSGGALPASAIEASLAIIERALVSGTSPSATRCFPVGHAHLDTAWLWDTRVTRQKLVRTAATALRTLDRVESFRFLCTQPQQYAWLEQDEPLLFEELRSAVEDGRWEPLGAMWIEPDGNLPSGESFCRQLTEGVRWMESRFGARGAQRLLFLPDSFGFAASLPQLAALAGLDTFVTNKLWWSESTEFPHANFRWRGIDGTELLSHLTPGQDYNATLHVEDLRRGERVLAERDEGGATSWMQPYGFGDGGGGPTPEQALRVDLLRACEGLPRIEPVGARAFCEALHEEAERAATEGRPLPVHEGELYLELHRGTWTTQAALKRANVELEAALRREEALAVLEGDVGRTVRARELWREVLLNQFHDILPGSGTREVVVEALQRYDEVARALEAARNQGERGAWFNPTSSRRDGAPPLGLSDTPRDPGRSARLIDRRLENGELWVEFDDLGRVRSLGRHGVPTAPIGGTKRPLFELHLHHDRPRRWEAWDLDEESLLRSEALADLATVSVEPIDGESLRVRHELRSGTLVELSYALDRDALVIDARIRWCEDKRLLRARLASGVSSSHWTASVPFGHVERSTSRNTAGERARFEMPVQRWMDLAEPGRGVTLLSDACHGGACHADELALSLLRATTFPDPVGDAAPGGSEHRFRFELVPHAGDWRAAGILDRAESIALAGRTVRVGAQAEPGLFDLRSAETARALVASLTHAEDDRGAFSPGRLRLRLVESHGARGAVDIAWREPVGRVAGVDLLGRPDPRARVEDVEGRTRVSFEPFQVVTLEFER